MAMQGEGSDFAENIRPFLRRMRGPMADNDFGVAASPRTPISWMLHPLVQNVMLSARAQGASELDAVRLGYAAHLRLVNGEAVPDPNTSGLPGVPTGSSENVSMAANLGSLLCGVLVGSFLGWMSVFFLLNASTNRTFKSGVMLGVFINILVLSLTAQESSPGSGSSGGARTPGESGGVWGSPNDSPWAAAVGGKGISGGRLLRGGRPLNG